MGKTGMGLGLVGLLVATPVVGQTGDWEVVSEGEIVVRTRPHKNAAVKEVWAQGVLDAEVQDLQSAILDAEAYPKFMPYVKESRYLGEPQPDGGGYVYTRLDLPFISSRDYVLKVTVEQTVSPDGSGSFRNRWVAEPDRIPSRHSVTRLRLCEGSWEVTPLGNGRSKVSYHTAVDPGGWIPAFAAESANKKGVLENFRAVEKEAQRRAAVRIAKQREEQERKPKVSEAKPVTPGT